MTDDDGSAALEFITVGVILLVPLVYLIIALGTIQEQTLGVDAAARHVARALATAPDAKVAAAQGDRVLADIAEQYGLDADVTEVSMSCAPVGVECPSAGAVVTITVTTRVTLPLIPALFGGDDAASVGVEGTAVQKISRLWGTG